MVAPRALACCASPLLPRAGAHGRGKAVLRASHDVDAGCIQPLGITFRRSARLTAARGLFLPRRERAGVGSGHELFESFALLSAERCALVTLRCALQHARMRGCLRCLDQDLPQRCQQAPLRLGRRDQ